METLSKPWNMATKECENCHHQGIQSSAKRENLMCMCVHFKKLIQRMLIL